MFDSGVGGLTVMRQLLQQMPHEQIIYFGDTARIPYGAKSPEAVLRYSIENSIFLIDQHIKILVVACNTATAYALEKLRRIFKLPVVGVIEPGAKKAVEVSKNGRIAVLGTRGTIVSGAYEKAILRLCPEASVTSIACPLLVHLVEENFLQHQAARLIIQDYLAPLKNQNIDTLLLGCTHYPLLKDLIQDELGPHINLVDSALTCALEVESILKEHQLHQLSHQAPLHRYYVSDDPEKFKGMGKAFLGNAIETVDLVHF